MEDKQNQEKQYDVGDRALDLEVRKTFVQIFLQILPVKCMAISLTSLDLGFLKCKVRRVYIINDSESPLHV